MKNFLTQYRYVPFVCGKFDEAMAGQRIDLTSPVTGAVWKELCEISIEGMQLAIGGAQKAFEGWKTVSAPKRAMILRQFAGFLRKFEEDFAYLICMEVGKPLREARGEVQYSAAYFSWYATQAEVLHGEMVPCFDENKRAQLLWEPVGVTAAITPWNFPLALACRKIAAALGAGCSILCKPSPEAPITLLALGQICLYLDLPAGVLSIVPGPEEEVGGCLLESFEIRKLSFTGSVEVGQYLYRESANTLKKLSLELGGHAPFIVFEDADVDSTLNNLIQNKFRFGGQTCIAANRVFVHETIYDDFVEATVRLVKTLTVGDPREEETELSTCLHHSVKQRVREHLQDALEKGADPLLIGEELYHPHVLGRVTPSMRIFEEETFGPVIPFISFQSEQEVVRLANHSDYGLAAYVFTQDYARIQRCIESLHYGIVGINDAAPSGPQASFGGVRYSGFGREGGPYGIHEYLTQKYISIG